jgi:hypothetical protein
MTSNEIRLGNRVYGRIGYFVRVNIDILHRIDKGDSGYSPIPLSEEILLKAGFEKEDNFWWDIRVKIRLVDNNSTIYITGGELPLIMLNNYKYVHQLQNLYFALTNTELQINL